MRFSNFLFPASASAADDGRIIDETLQEARLTDTLGFDTIWLAEHHFDGIVAYVDPWLSRRRWRWQRRGCGLVSP